MWYASEDLLLCLDYPDLTVLGAFMTGIFATASISSLDGIPTIVHGGWDGNGVQIAKQLAEIAAIFSWSFVLSVIMLYILKYVSRALHDVSDIC